MLWVEGRGVWVCVRGDEGLNDGEVTALPGRGAGGVGGSSSLLPSEPGRLVGVGEGMKAPHHSSWERPFPLPPPSHLARMKPRLN